MALSKEEFNNLSEILKLSLTKDEESRLFKDLNLSIELVETMNELNIDNEDDCM